MFAHNTLHGSGQAGFPHPALALGADAPAVVDPLSYDFCIHYTSPV